MIQIMNLVTQKHLLMSLKVDNQKKKIYKKKNRKNIKQKNKKKLEDKIKEKEEKSNRKIKELEDKNKNSATNQITNNFRKIIVKN